MIWQSPTKTLNAAEAEQLATQLSELGATGLPLEPGLRAAANESPEPRVSRALTSLADSIEQGSDLKGAMLSRRNQFPKSLRGYVVAATSGNFGEVLGQLVEQYQRRRELRATVRSAVAYPLLILILVYLLVLCAAIFLANDFIEVFREFNLDLPVSTKILFWLGGPGKWFMVGAAVVALLGPQLLRRVLGPALWCRIVAAVPVIGPMWHWVGVAEFSSVMAVLIERGIPLSEALRLASDATCDANVGQAAEQLAAGIDEGQSLSVLLASQQRLPLSLLSFVRWGEETGALPEAFRGAAELFDGRLQIRASLLRSILPTLAYLVVAAVVGLLVVSLLGPMRQLIETLSFNQEKRGKGIDDSLILIALLIALGAAPLWMTALMFGQRSAARYRALLITGWVFLAIGAGALSITISLYFVPLLVVVALAVAVRFWRSERRSLALAMAIAVERGIPLPHVLEAFAVERIDEIGGKARRMAELLNAGVSLRDALTACGDPLSRETTMATALGIELGCLDKALNATVRHAEERSADIRWALDKLVYVCVIFVVGIGMLTYMFIRIIPSFDEMFQEFGLELPALTQMIIETGRIFIRFWVVLGIVIVPLLGTVGVLAVLGYIGFFPRDLPFIRRLLLRDEGARVMRYLSIAGSQNRSLVETLQWLADHHPCSGVGIRLRVTARQAGQGGNIWRALRSNGLIRQADETVLKAAQQVGNLVWALDEMAASSVRRMALRTRAVVNVLFPAVLLFFGMCVFFIAVGFMLPLIDLTDALAR